MALILKDLNRNAYPVETVTNHIVRMNDEGMLTFNVIENDQTKDFINDISKMWRVENVTGEAESQAYIVVIAKRKALKDKQVVEVTAKEAQFDYLTTQRVYENVTGSRTAVDFLNLVFDDTPYSYVMLDSAPAIEWENAGDGQTKFDMFLKWLKRNNFEFQYEATSKTFKLGEHISRRPAYYISKRLNANDISFEEDATSFYTYVRGFGDYEGEDNMHEANLIREYPKDAKSPMIELFGIREAEPVTDGRITDEKTMDARLKKVVEESLSLSVELDFVTLGKNYPFAQPEIGDEIPVIDETIDFNRVLRIQEIKTTRDAHHKVIKQSIVVGDPKRETRYKRSQAGTISDMKELIAGRSNIRESVLPSAIKEATKMLQDTSSELSFSEQGIMAVDKDNPNYVTLLNSSGLGVSKDSGQTFHNAITRGQINASLITTGSMNADYIRSGTLDANLVEVVGGEGDKYVSIVNDELRLNGTFTRMWRGDTTTYNIFTSMKNGYLRFRNNDLDRSLYFSEFGISTYVDQTGEYVDAPGNSSGTIAWWDKTYSPAGSNGITINSYGGVAALTSNKNRVMVQAGGSVNLESTHSNVYIRPDISQLGQNTFSFNIANNRQYKDGYIMFGDHDNNAYASGVRFSRAYARLEIVDTNYSTGGDTTIEAGYGSFNTVTRRSGNSYVNIAHPDVFKVGADDNGDRVASGTIYNRTYSNDANVYVTSYGTLGRATSASKYKLSIENQHDTPELQYRHSSKLLDLDVKSWFDKSESEITAKECETGKQCSEDKFKLQRHVGLIAEEVESAGLSEHVTYGADGEVEGIEYGRLWIHLIPIIKDQQKRIKQLEATINGK
ncbi:phage tail protein [Staphylococcus sp. 18_1_E_LY]|uniref:Phage tail protein n=2 Tax=Staphylococcus lloydii TaxID=2781774 RepID=A0A7T1AZZ2_9STAP|nr:phage tail protein [Staphylococcus lloydii]MBF7019614.1 phage tail protein [Staphylococcus lloydii]MBF7027342.1 phage tail protein [Staphylococcus lloydii]QPM75006.1 phage tail protein [Staphylococcus lloydii]